MNPVIYPLNVVVTNRIVDSPISRSYEKRGRNLPFVTCMKDFGNIVKNVGFKGLYMGVSGQALTYALLSVRYFGPTADVEWEHPIGRYLVLMTIPLFNPLQMLLARMQWIGNPNSFSMRKTFTDMLKHEKLAIFYRGLLPASVAQAWFHVALTWAKIFTIE